MTTVALLRTTYLNTYLRRADGDGAPWTDAQCNTAITDALTRIWHDRIGKRATGTVATNQNSDVYTIPAALSGGRISRIELEQASGGITQAIDRVTSWRVYSDTQVRIEPMLPTDSTLSLRFFGFIPFQTDGSDLPVALESAVAQKAAGLAYGQELGFLVNAQVQQGIDSGRVVDYQTAIGLSAYWERLYQQAIAGSQYLMSFAPRRSRR